MAELNVVEAKKELDSIVAKEKKSVMSPEDKKVHDEKEAKAQDEKRQADVQKAQDDLILSKKESDRTTEEKEKAKVVLEQRQKDEEKRKADEEAKLPADDKVKRVQEKTQKRIDEVVSELKEVKDKNSKEAEEMRGELSALRTQNEELAKKLTQPKEDFDALLDKQEKERNAKYLQEDKNKPRAERREMSDEELNEWLVDNYAEANRWLARQERRKEREREDDLVKEKRKVSADDFIKRQKESMDKVQRAHPDLDVSKRAQELKAQGKSAQEIHDIIFKENDKYRTLHEIMHEPGADKYLATEDGPERAIEEMSKRLNSDNSKEQVKIDELTQKVEELSAELERVKNLDVGINSTTTRARETKEKLSEQEKILVDTMKSMNASEERIQSALEKFRKQKGGK